jgi:hypothetical protein
VALASSRAPADPPETANAAFATVTATTQATTKRWQDARDRADREARSGTVETWKAAHDAFVAELATAQADYERVAVSLAPYFGEKTVRETVVNLGSLAGSVASMRVLMVTLATVVMRESTPASRLARLRKLDYGVPQTSAAAPKAGPARPRAAPRANPAIQFTYDKFKDTTEVKAELGSGETIHVSFAGTAMKTPPTSVYFISTKACDDISHDVIFFLDGATRLPFGERMGSYGVAGVTIPRKDFCAIAAASKVEVKVDYVAFE